MTSVNGNDKGGDPNKLDDNHNSNTGFATASAAGSGTLQALRPNVVDRYWNDIAEHFREPGFSTFDKEKSSLVTRDPEFMRKLLLAVITDRPSQGDILPSVIAKSSCDFFTALDKAGKTEFLRLLARDFGVLQDDVVKAAQQYTDYTKVEPESRALLRAEQVLRHAIVPGHNKFFDRVSRLPGGLKFLIDMREDLLSIIQENRNDFYLSTLNESLKEKLQSWFVGFLDLERLTWQSPAVLLEKITQYEAVHKFNDFQDLKRRVGPGRRVFALMNKSLPTEPLVFVQVALVRLSGIELGNFLIKRVVRSLKVEFPQIETFSTLSPIPGFRKWLVQCQKLGQKLLLPQEQPIIARLGQGSHNGDPEEQLSDILQHPSTFADSEIMNKLRPILTRLCGRYILLEKRRYLALDPVANFHLRNGACAHRLNWLGDTSAKGMEESFGMMINYLYALDHIEMNNQQYLQDGMITVSSRDPGFDSALLHANAMTFSTTTSDQHSTTETGNNSSATAAGRIVQLNGARFRLLDIVTA
ncbi:hypothetical protein BGX34_010846 [Mortierella sp. NVP85]|nr:hypothetical protein BGX34_010846 [Mortierella sp. NVP85]